MAGIVIAALSAVINFTWLPYSPFWAILLIAVDLLIIWALASARARRGPLSQPIRARRASGSGVAPASALHIPADWRLRGHVHASGREWLVRDLAQQLVDDVEPAALLIVVVDDEPPGAFLSVAAIVVSRALQ